MPNVIRGLAENAFVHREEKWKVLDIVHKPVPNIYTIQLPIKG